MSEYRIPKNRRQIVVTLHSSASIAGDMFVQAFGRYGGGAEGPLDILNAPEPFFPLRAENGETVLVAKDRVVLVTCDRPDVPEHVWAQATPRVTVEIHLLDGEIVTGSVLLEVPEQHSRLLDFLNRHKQRFFPLETVDGQLLINQSMIESVRSLD